MKKHYYLTILCVLIAVSGSFAKIIRVNNQETANKPEQNSYITVLDAYNAADHGDTIYLEPTPVAHGALTIEKRLVFIGGGYFHDQNEGLTSNPFSTIITGRWTFALGSLGSKVIGFNFSNSSAALNLQVNDIEISNCYFTGQNSISTYYRITVQPNLENIVIRGCYFSAHSSSLGAIFSGGPLLNLIFSNNIALRSVNIPNNSTGIFANNLIQYTSFNIGANSHFQIHNNIFLGMNSVELPTAVGNNLSHNIANNTRFGTANNNQANVPVADIFIVSESLDGKYQIKNGGPAHQKGRNGEDIGPFGGTKPYKLSGLPEIPVVSQLITTGQSNADGKLPVTIKVKAN